MGENMESIIFCLKDVEVVGVTFYNDDATRRCSGVGQRRELGCDRRVLARIVTGRCMCSR